MLDGVRTFVTRNFTSQSADYRGSGLSVKAEAGIAAGWVAATTGVGYAVGSQRQAQDR